MKSPRIDILTAPIFIVALGLLLLNDFYLKYNHTSFLTGKLSDFSGLFLFPYFFSSFRPKSAKAIYIFTAILFIFWKSEFSQSLIQWVQLHGIGINRVVDYTDLIALFVLPLSLNYFHKQIITKRINHKALTVPLSIVSLFAIWATTLPREKVSLNLPAGEIFEVQLSKLEFFNTIHYGHGFSDTIEKNLSDSLFYLYFDITDNFQASITAVSTINQIDTNLTQIRLDTILHGRITGRLFSGVDSKHIERFKTISASEFADYFEKNYIDQFNKGIPARLYYDNKEILDNYGLE